MRVYSLQYAVNNLDKNIGEKMSSMDVKDVKVDKYLYQR